jgi:hypothetical protein
MQRAAGNLEADNSSESLKSVLLFNPVFFFFILFARRGK